MAVSKNAVTYEVEEFEVPVLVLALSRSTFPEAVNCQPPWAHDQLLESVTRKLAASVTLKLLKVMALLQTDLEQVPHGSV